MAEFQLTMPKMGESIMEATILKWLKKEGDRVELDEPIVEIATDKVDSEIPSPVAGKLNKVLYSENDIVPVGTVIAQIETSAMAATVVPDEDVPVALPAYEPEPPVNGYSTVAGSYSEKKLPPVSQGRFYSPLVRKIATEEGVSLSELDTLSGSGLHGRVTKRDILSFLETKGKKEEAPEVLQETIREEESTYTASRSMTGDQEIIQMDRMRKLISDHMVQSKKTSAHVTSFVEADVTDLVKWREANKDSFEKRHQTKLTFTPFFIQAVARAILEYPMINISVQGDEIILKKGIHIGMATALPSGNLIVPVIRNAEQYNLAGLARQVNDLSERARSGSLKPEEITGGTFTVTNVGMFGNVMGTPIINQPQVAILATGAIRKKPAVVETEYGDLIAVRHMMFLSLSYDHRVVDGALGGSFVRKVADFLEEVRKDTILS